MYCASFDFLKLFVVEQLKCVKSVIRFKKNNMFYDILLSFGFFFFLHDIWLQSKGWKLCLYQATTRWSI